MKKIMFLMILIVWATMVQGQVLQNGRVVDSMANQPDPANDRAAQVENDTKIYQIGDKLPKDFVIGYNPFDSLKTFKLSDFKGKAVILDAWATWCRACIGKFPIMDSLSKVYGNNLEILLVGVLGHDSPDDIRNFVSDYLKKHPDFSLTFLILEPRVRDSFFFSALPHYIWIDPNRRIRAYTNAHAFKDENLKRLMGGLPIYAPVKLR